MTVGVGKMEAPPAGKIKMSRSIAPPAANTAVRQASRSSTSMTGSDALIRSSFSPSPSMPTSVSSLVVAA